MHVNLDHFLETTQGRVVTEERNAAAWRMSYEALDRALGSAGPLTRVYVLVGAQGAGRSTWVRSQIPLQPRAVFNRDRPLIHSRQVTLRRFGILERRGKRQAAQRRFGPSIGSAHQTQEARACSAT